MFPNNTPSSLISGRLRKMPVLFLLILTLALPAAMYGQVAGGSIIGVVTDSSGAAMTGASVTARNLSTNQVEHRRTNETGYYEFPLLPAGKYQISLEAPGFQSVSSAEFELSAGTRPRFDFKLNPAGVAQSVEVTAEAPLVNASTTDLGVVIDTRKIDSLPLNGRNFLQLVGLQAGVVNAPSSSTGGRGGIEFNGSSALGNNLLLDGVDMSFGENNGASGDTAAGAGTSGALIQGISVEAIAEFKATGSAFSAEYGRSSGGVLTVVTKSGTNALHGTLFEFLRNDALDAPSFFDNRSGLAKPPLRWNQFGGNVGGPVIKDKLFYFFNYEGAIVRRNQQVTNNVATPALLALLTPALRSALSLLGPPTEATTNPQVGLSRRNDARRNDENTYLGRADWLLRNHRLAVRYNYNHQDFSQPTALTAQRQVYPQRAHNAVIQETATLHSNIVNEFRAGLNRNDLDRHYTNTENIPAYVGNIPSVSINPSLLSYIHYIATTYTLADNLTWIRGAHTFKMGFEIRNQRANRIQGNQPVHTYNTLDQLIADQPVSLTLTFGGSKGLRTTNSGYYFQDDWRVRPRLQVNLGLRYEYTPPLTGGFNIATRDPFGPFIQKGQPMWKPDRNNFAPRAGIVWDVLGNQKLVIRTGAGLTYVPPQPFYYFDMSYIDPALPFNAVLNTRDLPAGTSFAFPFSYAYVNQVAANPSLLPSSIVLSRSLADPSFRDEYSEQWNFTVQRTISKTMVAQASYVGSHGINLYSTRNVNIFVPALGRRPRPDLGDVNVREQIGRSKYHALQMQLNQRLSRGAAFDLYYTFAKSTAFSAPDSTLTTDSSVQDQFNIAGSTGPKNGEVRHRFVAVGTATIPSFRSGWQRTATRGWQIQVITSLRSGLPVNVLSGRDTAGTLVVAGQRPDLVGGVDPYLHTSDRLAMFNKDAFSTTAAAAERRFGNLGYNALRGPGSIDLDAALHRMFTFRERHQVTFRLEAFNAMNHFNPGTPTNTLSNPNFGYILSGNSGRNVQAAVKYQF